MTDWDELDRLSGPKDFTVAEVPLRVLGQGSGRTVDPWARLPDAGAACARIGHPRPCGLTERAETSAPELAGQDCGEKDEGYSQERGQDADGLHGIAQDRAFGGEEGDGERRVIDVSPVQVVGAHEVVELVAEHPVAAVRRHVEQQVDPCEGPHDERECVGPGRTPA